MPIGNLGNPSQLHDGDSGGGRCPVSLLHLAQASSQAVLTSPGPGAHAAFCPLPFLPVRLTPAQPSSLSQTSLPQARPGASAICSHTRTGVLLHHHRLCSLTIIYLVWSLNISLLSRQGGRNHVCFFLKPFSAAWRAGDPDARLTGPALNCLSLFTGFPLQVSANKWLLYPLKVNLDRQPNGFVREMGNQQWRD